MGLRRAGHVPILVAPGNYDRLARANEVPFRPLSGDVQVFLNGPGFGAARARGFVAVQLLAIRTAAELVTRWMGAAAEACVGSDLVVAEVGGQPLAEAVAEAHGVRFA